MNGDNKFIKFSISSKYTRVNSKAFTYANLEALYFFFETFYCCVLSTLDILILI